MPEETEELKFDFEHTKYRVKKKEDDVAVRMRIQQELKKVRTHILNIMEYSYEDGDEKGAESAKRLIDAVDTFSNNVQFSEVGHKYPFFSKQISAKRGDVKRLVRFDAEMINFLKNATLLSHKVENAVIEGNVEAFREIRKIKNFVSSAEGKYEERFEFIKRLVK